MSQLSPTQIKRLDRFIINTCDLYARVEQRPNDVKFQYRAIGDTYLLLAIKTEYARVRRRVENKMLKILPNTFGMILQVVYPDPMHDNPRCYENTMFDIIERHIDPNYTIDQWDIFGKRYFIRWFGGNYQSDDDAGTPHLENLRNHGYDHLRDDINWEMFRDAYKSAYGLTPFEFCENRIKWISGRVSTNE